MTQSSAIAAWLMLIFKGAVALVIFFIALLCLVWVIRTRNASKKKDADRG